MPYSGRQPMSAREAHQRIRHLLPGAVALAGTAGFVNTVMLGFFHSPVSHMTGAVSHLGIDIAEGKLRDAWASLSIIIGFVIGAMGAGILVGAWKLVPNRAYGVALMAEGGLLGIATALLNAQHRLALPAVAMACGLQNAMASSYCGLLIRTTHVTGVVTDIGVILGHWVRHGQVEMWKLRFLLALFAAFGVGGWMGALADLRFGPTCIVVPGMGCTIAGGIFWFVTHHGLLQIMQDGSPKPPRTGSFPFH